MWSLNSILIFVKIFSGKTWFIIASVLCNSSQANFIESPIQGNGFCDGQYVL